MNRPRYRSVNVADLNDLSEHVDRARRLLLTYRDVSTVTGIGLAIIDIEYVGRELARMAGRRQDFGAALLPSPDDVDQGGAL